MIKLYVSPGACSMSCHIAFEESRLPFEAVVCPWDNAERRAEIAKLNPQEAVPILVLDGGRVLTQNIAILTYVAEHASQAGLLPAMDTFERAQVFQWVSWVAADLHKAFGPLFDSELPEDRKKEQMEEIADLLSEAERHMKGKTFLVDEKFSIADAYLFTVYGWCGFVGVPTGNYPNLNAFAARVAERPAVRAVMKKEGLLK